MKIAKVEIPNAELKVWCERCRVRIAPNEEQTLIRGKVYHPRCRPKLSASGSKRSVPRV